MVLSLSNYEVFEKPFRYVVIKDCIKLNQAETIQHAYDLIQAQKSSHIENANYSKTEVKSASGLCGQLLEALSSQELSDFCSQLFPDVGPIAPDNRYDGGGLTMTPVGKFLRYHFDFPFSNIAQKYRVINAILYLSEPGIEGGQLHLLDPESGTVEAAIKPEFGTLAIFATSKHTPHGVSRIFNKPRLSINSYFYADKPIDDRFEPSKTHWLNDTQGVNH